MSARLRSTEDYYAAWDRHTAKALVARLGYHGAVNRCIDKNWHQLAGILQGDISSK